MPNSQVQVSLSVVEGRPAATSLKIAECFDKEHKNVLADIRNLLADCPDEFGRLNFQPSSYTNEQGKTQPMYIVYFDGFMLLVMGYTGKKALQMKLAYIEAFNAMRAKLEAQKQHPLPNGWRLRKGASPKVIERAEHCTHGEAVPIEKAVDAWCAEKNIRRLDALAAIRVRFGLKIFDRPPRHLHDDILAWINEQRGTSGKKPNWRQGANFPIKSLRPPLPRLYRRRKRAWKTTGCQAHFQSSPSVWPNAANSLINIAPNCATRARKRPVFRALRFLWPRPWRRTWPPCAQAWR